MSQEQEVEVRMDKSRDYATVHGERVAGDPHAAVHFTQNSLPFDAQGILIVDHAVFEPGVEKPSKQAEKLRDRAQKLMAKAVKNAQPKPEGEEAEEVDEGDLGGGTKTPANLKTWATGEVKVPWVEVTQAIAGKFARRVANKKEAIELLVDERIVAVGDLSDEHRKLIGE